MIAEKFQVLEKAGLSEGDRDSVLEMVMELSGARRVSVGFPGGGQQENRSRRWHIMEDICNLFEVVDSALQIVQQFDAFGIGGELANVTDRLRIAFENLSKTLRNNQKRLLDDRGFAFLHRDQLQNLYERQGTNLLYLWDAYEYF